MSAAFDWTLWIVIAALQILLASVTVRSRFSRSWFGFYVYFTAVKTFILLLLDAWLDDQDLHTNYSIIAAIVGTLFIGMAIREVWRNVFGPTISLPRGTVARFISAVVIIGSLEPVLVGLFRAHTVQECLNALLNIEVATLSAICDHAAFSGGLFKISGIVLALRAHGNRRGFLCGFRRKLPVVFSGRQRSNSGFDGAEDWTVRLRGGDLLVVPSAKEKRR
ncbi:MAG TPA: hypothetical protein VHA06_14990 [Candidatus Angelobacter sp.]|jgi:hypothetical protein|nr:hypothetical protein [Candidatus Angelobacter sp.]